MQIRKKRKELIAQVELRLGFEGLRKTNARVEDKFRKASEEDHRQEEVERTPPLIIEDGETECVFAKSLPGGFDSQ